MTTAYLRVILSMEILISYAPYRHQRYSSTNSLKRTAVWHGERKCLFPLRIYTALKLSTNNVAETQVCFPYEFTLLSNTTRHLQGRSQVCFPYEFTLLSNNITKLNMVEVVCFPYEFTLLSNRSPV